MAKKHKPVTLVERDGRKTDGMYQSGGPTEKYDPEKLKDACKGLCDDFKKPALDRINDIRNWLTKAISPHIDGPLDPQTFLSGEVYSDGPGWYEHLTLSTGAGCYHINAERHTWVDDCADALRENKQLELAIAQGDDLDWIVRLSVRQGQLIERIQARAIFAPSVLIGSRKSRKSQAQAERTNRKREASRPNYRAAVEAVMTKEKIKYTPACKQVAERFKVTPETVRNNTPELRPGRKRK